MLQRRRKLGKGKIAFALMLLGTAAAGGRSTPAAWQSSTPEAQGIDSRELIRVLKKIQDEALDLHSLIIARNGRVILECYLHPYDASVLHNVKSVSKSVMSALVGIALRKGILHSLDQAVKEFFPQYFADGRDSGKDRITLRHLLTMTAGLDLDENGPIEEQIYQGDDWIGATLERPLRDPPGSRFHYSTPLSHVMSGILSRASGSSLLELAGHYLFAPLGATAAQWTKDPQGYCVGGAELFMTPRAMTLFGMLYLAGGQWRGRELVPRAWVALSTTNRLRIPGEKRQYGYWWWVDDRGNFGAQGWGGQIVAMRSATGMVTVTTAANHGDALAVLRALRGAQPSAGPLAENPAALAELRRMVGQLLRPVAHTTLAPPETAQAVSCGEYELDKNRMGLTRLGLSFRDGGECLASLFTAQGSFLAGVGLDGLYRITGTGAFGRMPKDNRLALRGAWTSENTFTLHFHFLGEPWREELCLRFVPGRLEVEATVHPTGDRYSFCGRLVGQETGR